MVAARGEDPGDPIDDVLADERGSEILDGEVVPLLRNLIHRELAGRVVLTARLENVDADMHDDLVHRVVLDALDLVGVGVHRERHLSPDLAPNLRESFVFILRAFALELDSAFMHRVGLRYEFVTKHQDLGEADETSASSGKIAMLGHGTLDGYGMYGEAYGWILGDDRILPDPGLQLPTRLGTVRPSEPRHGLMIAARIDKVHESIKSDTPALADPNVGTLDVLAPEIGVNYWYTKRFRATFNYVANILDGTNATLPGTLTKNGGSHVEHEFLFRLGIAL